MATVRAMINVKNARFFLQVGDEKVKFHLQQSMAYPTLDDTCCRVDILENVLSEEVMTCHHVEDPLEITLIGCDVIESQIGEKEEYDRLLNASTTYTHR